jgi:hypothetical protein
MTSFDEIARCVEQRLEELLEESTRLGAALEALRGDHAPASRGVHADRTAKPVVKVISRDPRVKPRPGSAVTPADLDAADGNDATRVLRWNAPYASCAKSLPRACATDRTGGRDVSRESRSGRWTATSVPASAGCG